MDDDPPQPLTAPREYTAAEKARRKERAEALNAEYAGNGVVIWLTANGRWFVITRRDPPALFFDHEHEVRAALS